MRNYQFTLGNTLAEYGLIGLLVLGIGIGGLTQVGLSIINRMEDFQKSLVRRPPTQSAEIVIGQAGRIASGSGTKPNPTAQQNDTGGQGAGTQQTKSLIQVSGANGATRELVLIMENRIQQMLSNDEITDEQANLLQDLANRGHYLADAERALETAIAEGKTSILFNGKTYSPRDLASAIGYDTPPSSATNWSVDAASPNSLVSSFVRAYQTAQSGGALSDPEVNRTISNLAYQVSAAGDALNWNVSTFLSQGIPPSEWPQHAEQFNRTTGSNFMVNINGISSNLRPPELVSDMTDSHSAQICTTGSGTDSGQNCTPR